MIFGVTSGDATVSLSPFRIYNDEITVLGSMAVLNSFGAAADLMAAGAIDTAPLLGPPFALSSSPRPWPASAAGEGIKVQVRRGQRGAAGPLTHFLDVRHEVRCQGTPPRRAGLAGAQAGRLLTRGKVVESSRK